MMIIYVTNIEICVVQVYKVATCMCNGMEKYN
jgi:hypothetical protein